LWKDSVKQKYSAEKILRASENNFVGTYIKAMLSPSFHCLYDF